MSRTFRERKIREVLIINLIFYVNFAIFAVFATLLITEVMGAVLLLVSYEAAKKKVLEYIVPIWEVTGTFGAFWVVVTDFAFPRILLPAAHIFAVPLMLFLILIVARNASIVFGEYIMKKGWLDEKKLYLMYSLSTLALGIIVLSILVSFIGGAGIDLASGTLAISGWVGSPGNILFLIGALLIGTGLAPIFYGIREFGFLTIPATVSGVLVSLLSFYLLDPGLLTALIAIPVALTVLVPLLNLVPAGRNLVGNKLLFTIVASVIIFTLSPLVYPSAFGRTLGVDGFTTSGVMGQAFLAITVVGCLLLAVMIAVYLLAVRRSASMAGETGGQ